MPSPQEIVDLCKTRIQEYLDKGGTITFSNYGEYSRVSKTGLSYDCGCALSVAALPLVKPEDYPVYECGELYQTITTSAIVLRLGLTPEERDNFTHGFDGLSCGSVERFPFMNAGRIVREWYLEESF